MVPDETVNQLVVDRIKQPDCAKGFILDGYPRTVKQAEILMGRPEMQQVRTVVVHLKVDYNVIVARLAGRRQCPACGALYSLSPNTRTVSEVCDYDGAALVIRDDDREEVVTERLKAYDRQTAPVLEFFRKSAYPCLDLDGMMRGGPQAIAKRIQARLKEQFGA